MCECVERHVEIIEGRNLPRYLSVSPLLSRGVYNGNSHTYPTSPKQQL